MTPLWGGGFPRLEPLEESVPTHSSSTSTKTDSWASPQVTDSEFPGREDVYQVPQVILIIRQVWKALSPHRTNNPETFRGNLSPESHRHKQIHSLIHPANSVAEAGDIVNKTDKGPCCHRAFIRFMNENQEITVEYFPWEVPSLMQIRKVKNSSFVLYRNVWRHPLFYAHVHSKYTSVVQKYLLYYLGELGNFA